MLITFLGLRYLLLCFLIRFCTLYYHMERYFEIVIFILFYILYFNIIIHLKKNLIIICIFNINLILKKLYTFNDMNKKIIMIS